MQKDFTLQDAFTIQIQHLLKLNRKFIVWLRNTIHYSNTTFVKVKFKFK